MYDFSFGYARFRYVRMQGSECEDAMHGQKKFRFLKGKGQKKKMRLMTSHKLCN